MRSTLPWFRSSHRPTAWARRLAPAALVLAVVVGGLVPSTALAGTGRPSWVHRRPASAPPARYAHAMAYDPGVRRVIAFGGFGPTGYLNDTWAWDGADWSRVGAPGAEAPTPRAAAGMAYDRVTRQLVLFGGFDGGDHLGDTWTWDDATREWTGRHPAASPPRGSGPMLFTDPVTGHVDAFGGFDGQFYQLQTWTWTGSNWHRLHPAHTPSARAAAIAALDPTRGQVVLFGGLGDVNPDNTWTWDGTDWTDRAPEHQPPLRFDSAAAFDPRIGGVVLFGGSDGSGDLHDMWRWSGTDWREVRPGNPPSARESHGLAFDASRRRLVLFAGQLSGAFGRDTWTL